MGGETETIGIAEARSALAWWLYAGVDVAVQEEPRNWLKPAPKPQAKAAGEAAPTALRFRIRCRRREAPSVLCQIGNAFTGELAPRFVIVIDHCSLLS